MQPPCSHHSFVSAIQPPSSFKENCTKEQDTSGNPLSPKEMWIPCLSLIKNNFGKRPINTFPVTRETREMRLWRRSQRKGRKKAWEIWRHLELCVCVCDGSLGVIPMAPYSSSDTATNCSDVLTVTKWLTYKHNRMVIGPAVDAGSHVGYIKAIRRWEHSEVIPACAFLGSHFSFERICLWFLSEMHVHFSAH